MLLLSPDAVVAVSGGFGATWCQPTTEVIGGRVGCGMFQWNIWSSGYDVGLSSVRLWVRYHVTVCVIYCL